MTGNGRFITVEGVDGAGKTTALAHLAACLHEQGVDVVRTREPGGTELAESIRGLLTGTDGEAPTEDTETLLMFAARAQHLERLIRPALAAGQWVLCDRFTDATYAYQGGGRGMPVGRIRSLEAWVQGDFRPHRTLLFEVPVAEGWRRRARVRGEPDRFEEEGLAFLEQVQAGYRAQAEAEPDRIKRINAGRDWPEVARDLDAWCHEEVVAWRTGG